MQDGPSKRRPRSSQSYSASSTKKSQQSRWKACNHVSLKHRTSPPSARIEDISTHAHEISTFGSRSMSLSIYLLCTLFLRLSHVTPASALSILCLAANTRQRPSILASTPHKVKSKPETRIGYTPGSDIPPKTVFIEVRQDPLEDRGRD